TSDRRIAINNYFEASSPVAITLAQYFAVLFPEAYERFKKAFAAGIWVKDDPGPWLGRALIYKLQGCLHVDDKDEGPTVSFPCGFYQGGEMIIPDFDAKFTYSPGHVCFFESTDVYHMVSKFTIPPFHSKKHRCTPGRIGSVFFSPHKSLEELQDKYAGWA
ncbi:hypothetical protein JOM56_002294, partial [Amanita muscaria]